MRSDTHEVAHNVARSLPDQKIAKLSGLTDSTDAAGFGGLMALLSIQGADFLSSTQNAATDTSGNLGDDLAMLPSAEDPLLASDNLLQVAETAPPTDLTFLLAQSGSFLPPVQLDLLQPHLTVASNGTSAMGLVSSAGQSDGLSLPGMKGEIVGLNTLKIASDDSNLSESYRPTTHFVTASGVNGSISLPSAYSADLARSMAGLVDANPDKPHVEPAKVLPDVGVRSRAENLRVLKPSGGTENQVSRTLGADQIAVQSSPDKDLRQFERQMTRIPAVPSGSSVDSFFGSQIQYSGERVGLSQAASSVEAFQPEVYVAEQVNYWISRDVQNAELRLKGFDDLPIDVHISMQGKDAQVDFRTDHAEIRDILRTAELHLKDMLAREGLILSGVSVGTSARDEQGQTGQQQPNFSRQQAVVLEDPAQMVGISRGASRSGGAIDVFV